MKDALKWLAAIAIAATSVACAGTDRATDTQAGETAEEPSTATQKAIPVYREVTIPAGTTLRLDLASSIASDSSQIEDPVRATLRQAVIVDGATAIPMGAQVSGVVTDVAGSGRVKGRARIAYQFSAMRVGDERYDIATTPVSHLAPATKGEDAKKIGIGAGAGAAIGAILGGGGGAVKGAAIGGAGGTGVVLATKGQEVRLGPGANVSTKLTSPLTVRVKV